MLSVIYKRFIRVIVGRSTYVLLGRIPLYYYTAVGFLVGLYTFFWSFHSCLPNEYVKVQSNTSICLVLSACTNLPRPFQPNSSPLDVWSSLCLVESALAFPLFWTPNERGWPQGCGSGLWALVTHLFILSTDIYRVSMICLYCSRYWGLSSEQRDKTSERPAFGGLSFQCVQPALPCLLDADARRLGVLSRLLCPLGFCRSWVAVAVATLTGPLSDFCGLSSSFFAATTAWQWKGFSRLAHPSTILESDSLCERRELISNFPCL